MQTSRSTGGPINRVYPKQRINCLRLLGVVVYQDCPKIEGKGCDENEKAVVLAILSRHNSKCQQKG